MALDTGWLNFTTMTNVDYLAGRAWTDINNVLLSDNNYASAIIGESLPNNTDYCYAKGLVNIPTVLSGIFQSIILKGIEVGVEIHSESTDPLIYVRLLDSSGALTGNTKQNTVPASADVYTLFGGSSDLWGTTLTIADILSANFGVSVYALYGGLGDLTMLLDHIKMKIYYEPRMAFFI